MGFNSAFKGLKTLSIVGFQEEWDGRGMWHAWG